MVTGRSEAGTSGSCPVSLGAIFWCFAAPDLYTAIKPGPRPVQLVSSLICQHYSKYNLFVKQNFPKDGPHGKSRPQNKVILRVSCQCGLGRGEKPRLPLR